MSTNIRFANTRDGKHDWPHRKSLLSSLINNFSPSLLGTQEGREPQLRELDHLLPNMKLIDEHRDWIKERMYPCIFIDPNVVTVKRSGDIWLSETPLIPGSSSFDSAFPRLCTWIEAEFRSHNQKFIYVNTHLDHLRKKTRASQIKVLLDQMDIINKDKLPVVISGDFNEDPFGEVRKQINNHQIQLRDPWFDLQKEEDISFHKFEGHLEDASRIDWILADPYFHPISIELNKDNLNGLYPSDHFFVQAEFTLKQE